jgi:hypothetical protein
LLALTCGGSRERERRWRPLWAAARRSGGRGVSDGEAAACAWPCFIAPVRGCVPCVWRDTIPPIGKTTVHELVLTCAQVRSEAPPERTVRGSDAHVRGWLPRVPQCHRLRDPRKPLRLRRGMGTTADLGESNGTRPGHHRSEQKRERHRRRTSPSSPRRGKGISPFFPILPSSRGPVVVVVSTWAEVAFALPQVK